MSTDEHRTLVFSFDGTGNEPSDAGKFEHDESISNVLKLHVLLGGGLQGKDLTETKTLKGTPQLTYYYNGIGTRDDGGKIPLVGWLISKFRRGANQMLAPSWGDASRILDEAKKDLKKAEPTQDDRLVVFGFSRGAALARKFASIVLRDYKELDIAFLGVFDTVAAMNGIHRSGETLSSDVFFENGTVNERVERAIHIVSLDENRIAFEPTLMNRDKSNPNRITEIWFPGVHGDIGGGYWYDGLADVSLNYMIDRCREQLGKDILIEKSGAKAIDRLLKNQGPTLEALDVDDILIHPNVTGVTHAHTEGFGKLYSKEFRKVCVWDNDRGLATSICRPLVHHAVKARFDLVPDYRPPALRGLQFKLLLPKKDKKTGIDSIPINGIAKLREYKDKKWLPDASCTDSDEHETSDRS